MSPQPSPPPYNPTHSLLTQLCVGPAFREVAGVLLRQSLQELYPELDIDPDIAMVGTPAWDIVGDEIIVGPPRHQHLSDILAHQAVSGVPTLYIEGVHYLIQQKNTHPTTHLPVRISEIANLLNVLAPVMLTAFQEQQVAYWNASNGNDRPHWRALSDTLRSAWNVTEVEGWTWEECNMAFTLYRSPELTRRQEYETHETRACLIDVDRVVGETVKHWGILSIAVLIGTVEEQSVILTYSMLNGYQKFTSLEQLGQSLTDYLKIHAPEKIQWRLFEPSGHFFDHQACTLIAQQLAFIGQIDLLHARRTHPFESSLNIPPATQELAGGNQPQLKPYLDALPDWLTQGSSTDLSLYARYLKDLSALHTLNAGKSYDDDIPNIQKYALNRLREEMLKEHSDAGNLRLEKVEIRVRSVIVWGSFTLPGKFEDTTFTLAELALQNLISLPIGEKNIRLHNGNTLPAWLTVPYVETLIRRVDIGKNYPILAKSKLLDDVLESNRRKALFSSHLRIQLPLLALQYKMSEKAGLDELGYRYVVGVLAPEAADRKIDGLTIVLRPLAFVPKNRGNGSPDVVTNMFVIGPEDLGAGPCLLYRPMAEQQLVQYASPADLLYAVRQSPHLRDSVLAWLPDSVRSDYARYAFPGELPSPWAAVELLVDPVKLLMMSGPMDLGTDVLNGDLPGELFKANANALITLAERQSVSNSEARWASIKQAGWLVFNAALPFLGRTVNTAAWIWQILDQLQDVADAQQQGDKPAEWSALTALLLNLGMALTLHIASRSAPPGMRLTDEEQELKKLTEAPEVKTPAAVKQVADLVTPSLPGDHPHALHTLGALNRDTNSLRRLLDSFETTNPDVPDPAVTRVGARRYLYPRLDKWYAPVGERWFEVTVDENDHVQITDPKQPTRKGPFLISNLRGNWFVDTRLRLRGGGSRSRVRAARAVAELEAAKLRKQITDFEQQKKAAQERLQTTQRAMSEAPSTSTQTAREAYLRLLDSQRAGYETALQNLKELNVFDPTPDFQPKSIGYIKAQLGLSQAGLFEVMKVFSPKLRTTLDNIDRQAENPQVRHIAAAREMTEMLREMIRRLDYFQTRFDELRELSAAGLRVITIAKGQLPSYGSETLKTLQVTLARNLCLHENSTLSTPLAWTAIDHIVDACDIAIQALHDTLIERSNRRIDERIDSLGSLIEQFTVLGERLQDLPDEFPGVTLEESLTRLGDQLSEYKKKAAIHLALLTDDRNALRANPRLPVTAPRPEKKFIRTRYNGVVVGEPQLSAVGQDTGLVDVRSPLSNKVVATFHEKTPGVWVQQHRSVPAVSAPADLHTSVDAGQELLDELPAFKRRVTLLAEQPQRTPIGIEYLFHQHAQRLEQATRNIEQALTRKNLAHGDIALASSAKKSLSDAATALYKQATDQVLKMTKQRPPTPSGVQWLKDRNAIVIKKTVTRRRIKSKSPDYLDEYTLTDSVTHKVLWYAHFHYSTDWTPPRAFLSARLKTPQEHSLGAAADTTHGMTNAQRVEFHRSEIGEQQARALFFT
ncbi:dermonecrotic toxin domain-containing protein [Pseudomonas reactans]|uniref:dermonecrotic toxin domain-containing protein n=1 Tax=Pseudomonas reactans TaxID=117680 RepID=UPI001C4344A1|nr:DUF6543 domain-containing protein [Pseudomonas reactans]